MTKELPQNSRARSSTRGHWASAADEAVVVTGGGSGIAPATALTAARSGLAVAVWDIFGEAAAETTARVERMGMAARVVAVDVAGSCEVAAARESSLALGRCAYLVNNAGPPSGWIAPFSENPSRALSSVELVTTSWIERCGEDVASVVNVASIAGNFSASGGTIQSFYPAEGPRRGVHPLASYSRWRGCREPTPSRQASHSHRGQ